MQSMQSMPTASDSKALPRAALQEQNTLLQLKVGDLTDEVKQLKHQLAWLQNQIFGATSEKRLLEVPGQEGLFDADQAPAPDTAPTAKHAVAGHERGTAPKQRDADCLSDSGLRFTADVPVEVIEHLPPELAGPHADDYEIIDTRVSYKLAQRAASYVVIKHTRPVFRPKGSDRLITPPAPANVLDASLADVSFLAGMLVDKFQFHLPLYRQHQRLKQAGITLSRSTLTNLGKRAIELLKPIVNAQLESVLRSRVLAMDETPIKAGHQGRAGPKRGTMKTGWFWPLYGDNDEVVFTYSPSRARQHIDATLDAHFDGTLLTDGYAAYARYAEQRQGMVHAQCWTHARRTFIRAEDSHPERVNQALQLIAQLYHIEKAIRRQRLTGPKKRQYRLEHAEPVVKRFLAWCHEQQQDAALTPTDPLAKAVGYVTRRETSLTVFLEDPDVPLDTNHLERALRPIPIGRKNWMFCWTELGAEHLGIIQSLITTCKLHEVNPYTYLVDVLQRVGSHPARQVADLTPRLWKTRFADAPLRSYLDPWRNNAGK
jgi:transposase